MDGRDEHLHAARRRKLGDLLGLLLVHVRGGAQPARHHGRQDEAGPDDERVAEQEGAVGRQGDGALHRLDGLRRLGEHLREGDVLHDRRRRVRSGGCHQLARVLRRAAHAVALRQHVDQVVGAVRGGVDPHHQPEGRGPHHHVRPLQEVCQPSRHSPAQRRASSSLRDRLVDHHHHRHHRGGGEHGTAGEDRRVRLPRDRGQGLRRASGHWGGVAPHRFVCWPREAGSASREGGRPSGKELARRPSPRDRTALAGMA
mmetsp:Transcript_34555/g.109713  ORF Transcript_34555/g.109713 Transcript_34555/m.109713 type:complete len:257 (-) Transcript_34555:4-774(-)